MRRASQLEVPVTELTGSPPRVSHDPEAKYAAVDRIRLALSEFDFLSLLLQSGSAEVIPAPDDGGLTELVRHAWVLTHESLYTGLTPLLCNLLGAAEEAARSRMGAGRERAFGALADVYQVAAAVMAKLGETDLAWSPPTGR
ncbi:MAG: hypothetical protein QOG45_2983 [Chloroflexota bacterium]|nr:hypothetical protein [Chloroflexota bacterium]